MLCSSDKPSFSCVGFGEIDKYANQLLSQKFPNIPNFGDATKINPSELPDFDMLCGGFPCQSFSIAGKRRGFQDTRGTMFFHIARILEVKRPKLVFLENVKGLLNHDQGKTFSIIIQTLEELGYEVQHSELILVL
jgi:DNA (cytosine-5)-methyltransferase 1